MASEMKRLKHLEWENQRLKRSVANLNLDMEAFWAMAKNSLAGQETPIELAETSGPAHRPRGSSARCSHAGNGRTVNTEYSG